MFVFLSSGFIMAVSTCIKEGKSYAIYNGPVDNETIMPKCCDNLTSISVSQATSNNLCMTQTSRLICTKCGDNKCGLGENKCNCPEDCLVNIDPKPSCKNLYWLDNNNKDCSKKKFCGLYMYQGLMTFEKLSDCKKTALNLTNSTKKETYGECVSKATKLKDSCLKQVELELKDCKLQIKNLSKSSNLTLNRTEIARLNKECSEEHKNSTEICKSDFKELKDLCEPLRCSKNQIFVAGKCLSFQRQCNSNLSKKNLYNYTINNIQDCSSLSLNCSKDQKPFYDSCGCGCKSEKAINLNNTENNTILEKHYCTARSEICTEEYSPVCGWFNSTVQCLKYPCAQNYSNGCQACSINSTVEFWTQGECPK